MTLVPRAGAYPCALMFRLAEALAIDLGRGGLQAKKGRS